MVQNRKDISSLNESSSKQNQVENEHWPDSFARHGLRTSSEWLSRLHPTSGFAVVKWRQKGTLVPLSLIQMDPRMCRALASLSLWRTFSSSKLMTWLLWSAWSAMAVLLRSLIDCFPVHRLKQKNWRVKRRSSGLKIANCWKFKILLLSYKYQNFTRFIAYKESKWWF